MEEVVEITYRLNEAAVIEKIIETKRLPKNRQPKPHYRGIEICNKTPIRIRGFQVEITKTLSQMRTLKDNIWTIKKDGKIISYANEIHLKDVEFTTKGEKNKVAILGIIVSPSDETRKLDKPVGYSIDKPTEFIIASACVDCQQLNKIDRTLPLARLDQTGVKV